MNLLAHLWLADRSHTSAAGQILGDIVRGRVSEGHFQPAVTRGIRLHRLIDSSCDAHKAHRDLRRSFSPPMRRFAGIIVDIGFDYALARNWACYHDERLSVFARRLATQVQQEWPATAPRPAPAPQGLANVLAGYQTSDGIEKALVSVGSRLQYANPLHRALPQLVARYSRFEAGLPALLAALEKQISRQVP